MRNDLIQLYRISYYEDDKLINTDYKLHPVIIPFIGNKIVLDLLFVEANVTSVSKTDTNVIVEVEIDGKIITIDSYGEDIIYAEDYGKEEEED